MTDPRDTMSICFQAHLTAVSDFNAIMVSYVCTPTLYLILSFLQTLRR